MSHLGPASYVLRGAIVGALLSAGCVEETSAPPPVLVPVGPDYGRPQPVEPSQYVVPFPPSMSQPQYSVGAVAPPSPTGQPWPSVPYGSFLADSDDEAKRQQLWSLFHAVEREAHAFVLSPDKWVTLVEVKLVPQQSLAGEWTTSGVIHMKPDNTPGVMFHEVFHTAFHRSVLHAGKDVHWGEAFCDAFRYAAERELLPPPPSSWANSITRFTTMTEAQAMAPGNGSLGWKRAYGYPASIVVKRSGGTMEGLRKLWFELVALKQQRGTDVLDGYFGWVAPGVTAKQPSIPRESWLRHGIDGWRHSS